MGNSVDVLQGLALLSFGIAGLYRSFAIARLQRRVKALEQHCNNLQATVDVLKLTAAYAPNTGKTQKLYPGLSGLTYYPGDQ